MSDSLNSIYSLNSIAQNTDIVHTAVFIEPVFDSKAIKENFDPADFDNLRDILRIPSEEKKNLISRLNSLSIPASFVINKKATSYNFRELSDILTEAKKQNKDFGIYIYPEEKADNMIDFMSRLESLLSRYYNTDYIETKTDTKSDAEIR